MYRSTSETADRMETYPDDAAFGSWGHESHSHTFGQLIYAITGEASLTSPHLSEGRARVSASSAVWFPPHVPHAARFSPGFVPLTLRLELPEGHESPMTVMISQELRQELLALTFDEPATERAVHRSLARAASCQLGSAPEVVIPTGPLAGRVAQALRADLTDERTLEDWAVELHTSVMSLRRAFRAETGLPFTQWRSRLRLAASLDPLLRGEPVTSVAHSVGFSHNGFLAAFRRHFGCAPSEMAGRMRRVGTA